MRASVWPVCLQSALESLWEQVRSGDNTDNSAPSHQSVADMMGGANGSHGSGLGGHRTLVSPAATTRTTAAAMATGGGGGRAARVDIEEEEEEGEEEEEEEEEEVGCICDGFTAGLLMANSEI